MNNDGKSTRYAITVLIVFASAYIIVRFGTAIASVILPFAAAAVFAQLLSPPSRYLSEKLRIPINICCIFTVISFFAMLFCSVYLVGTKLFYELSELSGKLPFLIGSISQLIDGVESEISGLFPFMSADENADIIKNALSGFSGMISQKLTSFVSSAVVFVPKFVLSFFVTVVATCYFTIDLKRINRFILCQIPEEKRIYITECKKQLSQITAKYLGAYLTIALITFAELFTGLTFMKNDYAFLIALIVTAVDILPILGSGTVLLPWAAAEYFLHDAKSGTKILLLYLVITVVRQLIEPKIVGDFIGLYPLTALFAVFAGGIFAGFLGMFLFPVVCIIIKDLNEKGLLKLYKTPPEDTGEKLSVAKAKYKRYRRS